MEKQKTPAKKTVSKASKMNDDARSSMPSSALMKLFEDELKDIYWAEKTLLKALPKMIDNATSEELIEALTNHLAETEEGSASSRFLNHSTKKQKQ